MATNYTTKTASLKATQADIRKVEATKLMVSPDGKSSSEKKDVLELISDAQKAAAISVGRDADTSWSVTEDEVTTGVKKINFMGAYVNVVPDGDTINLYIGENKNKASYSSITDTFNDQKYVYASSTSAWTLPSDATAGSQYARCSALTGTETVKLNDGAVIGNITSSQKIKVTVESDKGTIVHEAADTISSVAGKTAATLTAEKTDGTVVTTDAPTTKTWADTTKGITISASGMMKYTSADAKNGFTPESSCGVFSVTIDNDKVVGTKGGWYKVTVALGSTSKTTKMVYVYGGQANTPSTAKPVITYTAGTTKYISGLAYDSSGSFTLTVDSITNTQQAMTTSLNRVKVTKTAGDVDFGATVTTTTTGMSVTGTSTDETAVYKYVKTLSASATTAKKVSAAAKAQAYGQSALAGSELTSDTCTATTYLYTDNSDDTDLVTKFQKDGARKYGDLADAKSASGATATYDSQKSLITDYTDQLLVQDSKLRYPNSDKTSRYSGATETRYYVRPVKFGGSGQINNISVTVSGMTAFNNGTTRLYLVKKGVSDAQVLNWFKTAACSYGAPIADASAPSSNKWTCTINNDVFQLVGGVADTYYLVVEMTKDAGEIGQITLA